ncbi:FxLYD domain-containing protein [Streptomyces sp. NPDC020681]|uniref:FxLYD domain-containing protein n=1 Tax=Streptomyces sp. NPDC020681 TaxID=3365083 RepID=UPI00378A9C40
MAGYRMPGSWKRRAVGAVVAVGVAVGAAGCTDDSSSPSDVASKAASAIESAGAEVTAAASSLSSQAAEAVESATTEAQRKLDEIKGGVNAKDVVKLGAPRAGGEGRITVTVTATNATDSDKSFAVQVNFRDQGGNLLDTVVVTVRDVAAGTSGNATAVSNRKLSGEVKAEVGSALRY